jgi:hypothetical protein
MAKRTTSSKALGYQESFFANRNDMLQSALDAVLLRLITNKLDTKPKLSFTKNLQSLLLEKKKDFKRLLMT